MRTRSLSKLLSVSDQPGDGEIGLMEEAIRLRLDGGGCYACDIRCVRCSYNLRGIEAKAVTCPECGAGVGESVEHYRRWWFQESWLRGYVIGTACLMGVLMVLPASIVVMFVAFMFFKSGDEAGVCVSMIWTAGFVLAGIYTWLICMPVAQRGRIEKKRWMRTALYVVGQALIWSGWLFFLLIAFGIAGSKRDDSSFMLAVWLFFTGVSMLQISMAWSMIAQHGELSVQKRSVLYWIGCVPAPGLIFVLLNLWLWLTPASAPSLGAHWRDMRVMGAIAMVLIGTTPAWFFMGLAKKIALLVDEGVHARLAGRADGSVPEGVDIGEAFWPWWQRRMAARHEKRLKRMMHQGK
jgi:hypothetical protein